MTNQSTDQRERKMTRLRMPRVTKRRMILTRVRRKRNLKLQKISSTKTQWTLRRRGNSNLSGKSTVMVIGEKDLVKPLSLLRLRFQPHLTSFYSHQRKKLSFQSNLKLKTESRKSHLLLKRRNQALRTFCYKKMPR